MKSINLINRFCKNFIIEGSEEELVKKTIYDKIESKQSINIFCAFTFITPNYRGIKIINDLAKISCILPNINIFLVLSDNNILSQNYLKELGLIKSTLNVDMFIDSKIQELKNLLLSFGANPSQVHVYRFSDVWKKFVREKSKDLFLEYYSSISKIDLQKLNLNKLITVARIFQFSLDGYISTIFHLLFPDDLSSPIDFFYGRFEKRELYNAVRNALYEEGIIKIKKPLFLFMAEHPDLIFKSRMPEWNMSQEEIYYIIDNIKLNKEDYLNIIDFYKENLEKCDIIEGSVRRSYTFSDLRKKLQNSTDTERKNIVTVVIHTFLQGMKSKVKINNFIDNNLYIKDKATLKNISKLFKTKHMLDVIELADGTNNLSDISKKLKISASNLSRYIKELKEVGLLYITKDKKIKKAYKNLRIDIDNIN